MIEVVDHDPAWLDAFELEAGRIGLALGRIAVRIHHIGSTAVPGLRAKPVIDILLETSSLEALDAGSSTLEALGYEAMGEFGIPGRRYFSLTDARGTRTHQLHAFEPGVPNVVRHLAFRDYMRAHPSVAGQYGALKRRLANIYPDDMAPYKDGKDAFVKEHERRALGWSGDADTMLDQERFFRGRPCVEGFIDSRAIPDGCSCRSGLRPRRLALAPEPASGT